MRRSMTFQKWSKSLGLGIATAVSAVVAGQAAPIAFVGQLLPANENPPTASNGGGTAIVILNPAANTLDVSVTFSGLTSGTTASHIHCCEAVPGANANVGVATTTPTFAGFPLGVTSGTYHSVLDLTQASSYNPAFITSAFDPSHTVAGAEAALINGIENQETYLNIHTSLFPSGEVRGLLVAPKLTLPADASSNSLAIAGGINAIFASGAAPAEFVSLLFNVPAASLPTTLEQAAGANESGAAQTGHESAREFLSLVLDPFAGARPAQGAPLGVSSVWGGIYGGYLRINERPTGSPEQSNSGEGLAFGLDYTLAPAAFVGAAFGLDRRDFKIPAFSGSGSDNGYHFALYGRIDFDSLYLQAAGAYSIYHIHTSRTVAYTGASGSYNTAFNGHGLGGRVELGFHLPVTGLTAFGAVISDSITMPAYSERVESGSTMLAVQSPSNNFRRTRSELGLDLGTTAEAIPGPLLAHIRAGWAHEYDGETIPIAFEAFPEQGFVVRGAKLPDSGFVSGGLAVTVMPNVTLGANLEGMFGSGSAVGYGGNAEFRVIW
jgi:outer membrane autotransporter protein